MKQQKFISLTARENAPATRIHTVIHSENGKLGRRDVLLLIPGGPGNDHTTYDAPNFSITQALLPYVDIILFDPRGCGNSEKSAVEFCTLDHYIADIEDIRAHFNIPADRLIVFGQSYGAIAALGYATRYSEKIKKLLLIGGAASSECLSEAQENLRRIGTVEQKKWGEKIWVGAFPQEPEAVAEYYEVMGPLYSYTFTPGQPAPDLRYNVELFNFGFGNFLKSFDFRPQLANIKCPTLLLWGEDDWILDKKQGLVIHQALPHSELKIYPQCSHMLWMDQWTGFLRDTIEFLGRDNL